MLQYNPKNHNILQKIQEFSLILAFFRLVLSICGEERHLVPSSRVETIICMALVLISPPAYLTWVSSLLLLTISLLELVQVRGSQKANRISFHFILFWILKLQVAAETN